MSDLKGGKWYIKYSGKVEGPFTAGLVSRYILLGRLRMDDEVSEDKQNWLSVKHVPSLIPDILNADMSDPLQKERLMAARRWADERLAADRRSDHTVVQKDERRSSERRNDELDEVKLHRSFLAQRTTKAKSQGVLLAGLFLVAIVISIGWSGYYAYQNKPEEVVIDCNAVPGFAVNWTNCILLNKNLRAANLENSVLRNARLTAANLQSANLQGADMAYVDLSQATLIKANLASASLKGANLVNADMQGAKLVNVDLSFANLTGANIRNIDLSGAKLSKAIWVDGSVCGDNAVGRCH